MSVSCSLIAALTSNMLVDMLMNQGKPEEDLVETFLSLELLLGE